MIIKDSDCTRQTPILHGQPDKPIYGAGVAIRPGVPGKNSTTYEQKIHLSELLPLEDYDLFVVLFSGGKDSTAAYFRLIELGVPKEEIELWHHDIDGEHPERRMDWPVTRSYVRAFAKAEGVKLRVSWRENGFWGEVFRIGASYPIHYEDDGTIKRCRLSAEQTESERLRQKVLSELNPEERDSLLSYGHRMKFPAKSGDLNRRWCSAYLKITVADTVLRDIENQRVGTAEHRQILIVSGERRGESSGRAKYNEMEVHRTSATAKAHRLVHQWRAVIDYSERDVWEVLKRHRITPHPCYSCGWNRCSCAKCIFSLPKHWAGIRELFPGEFEAFCQDEINLGFTLDNKKSLPDYVGDAKSCLYRKDTKALQQLVNGNFSAEDIYCSGKWEYPAGAFGASDGGPC